MTPEREAAETLLIIADRIRASAKKGPIGVTAALIYAAHMDRIAGELGDPDAMARVIRQVHPEYAASEPAP